MRSIYVVIEAIRNEVPKNWEGKERFNKALDDVLDSAKYRAPEAYATNFDQLAMKLENHLGDPNSKWKKKIADNFADKIELEKEGKE